MCSCRAGSHHLTRAAVRNAQGKYLEQGYVSTRETQVPYVPFLVAVGA